MKYYFFIAILIIFSSLTTGFTQNLQEYFITRNTPSSFYSGSSKGTGFKTVKNVHENWYFYLALGYSYNLFPAETKDTINLVKEKFNASAIPFALEGGIYWNLGDNQTILGPSFNIIREAFSKDGNLLDFATGHLAVSLIHYFISNIGDNLYGRADIGLGFGTVSRSNEFELVEEPQSEEESGTGPIVLLGLGYGLPISSETRLTFSANYIFRHLSGYETGKRKAGDNIFEKGSYQ